MAHSQANSASAKPVRVGAVRPILLWSCAGVGLVGLGILCWWNIDPNRSVDESDASEDRPASVKVASKVKPRHTGEDTTRPFLRRHCEQCHGEKKPRGKFRVTQLSTDFANRDNRDRWLAVLKRIEAGEMPPKSKPRPPRHQVRSLTSWIRDRLNAQELASGRVVLRRLNRGEYENTVRDLLGVQVDLQSILPADGAAHGFDNVADALHVSSFLMERYLEAADKALNLAIANGPKPPPEKKRYDLKEDRHVKIRTERVFRRLDDALVFFSSSPWQAVTLGQFYPPRRGTYRFRISAYGFQSSGKPVTYRILAGPMLMATKNWLVGYFDAPADKPGVVEFTEHLEARNTINILPYGLPAAQTVHKVGADDWKGAGLAVQWIEVEGPLNDTWPPPSHRRIFGNMPQAAAPVRSDRSRVEVVSKDPETDAQRILRDFTRRAFRRAITDEDIKPFVALVKKKRDAGHTFEQAIRVGLLAVMLSPEFLFLREKPGKLDDFALASRLSYFLWSTMPDDELLTLAEKKQLHQPEVLRKQVERLLKHPKAKFFTENFVGQWLGLRDIDFTEPSHIFYPEFDHLLKVSMVRESELFFAEVLKDDLSLTNFVASDFAMLNGRLAKHYGITGPTGWEFRKVKLPANSHRGGVLTMASVLKVTANGTTTSPVTRGVWVLERILGTPTPPPPPDVPAVEPDIRGATTIREQLAKHRKLASCASCHVKIDPPGFALESFDAIGGWREYYRTTGRGKPVTVDGRRMHYLQGPKVDPSGELPDGRKFRDVDDLKRLLLKDKDQLARALTEKLLTYATGAPPGPANRRAIDAIVRKIRDKNYGLRTLVHEIVQSKVFQTK